MFESQELPNYKAHEEAMLEKALTGFQVTEALALLVATHRDGEEISRQITEGKGRIYRPGYVFDYAKRDVLPLDIELQEFMKIPIFPPYALDTPRFSNGISLN